MQTRNLLLALVVTLPLVALVRAAEVDDNCTMCHDAAPVPSNHMPLDDASLESCQMCHAGGDTVLVTSVHSAHVPAGLDCETCHSNGVSDAERARLKELLGQ